jgi:hypothetical protein
VRGAVGTVTCQSSLPRPIDLRIVATDPRHTGNYLRNIRVVTVANEAAAKAGQIFNPVFLKLIQNFRALRFMDWFQTNGSTLASWTDRPIPTDAFFGTSKGVPIRSLIKLRHSRYYNSTGKRSSIAVARDSIASS